MESLPKSSDRNIVVVIDAISSNPGMALPWEEMTRIARGMGIWTLIDGAHAIGQLPLDVKKADPDFLVSVSRKLHMQMCNRPYVCRTVTNGCTRSVRRVCSTSPRGVGPDETTTLLELTYARR